MRKSLVKILLTHREVNNNNYAWNLTRSYLDVWLQTSLMFAYTNAGCSLKLSKSRDILRITSTSNRYDICEQSRGLSGAHKIYRGGKAIVIDATLHPTSIDSKISKVKRESNEMFARANYICLLIVMRSWSVLALRLLNRLVFAKLSVYLKRPWASIHRRI